MRFLKPAIAGLSFFIAGTAADAADMAAPKPMMPPPSALTTAPMNWTGFYVGVNGGYGWADAVSVSIDDPLKGKSVTRTSGTPGGFVGGGQAGYNWQSGYWVFGFEADLQYVDLGGAVDWNGYDFLGLKTGSGQYFGTVRARLGYAVERSMFYLTGGYAYGGLIDNRLTGNATSNQGYTLGGGFEYAFTENWTGRVEGLYVNLEGKAKTATVTTVNGLYTAVASAGDGAGLVRLGVNYKF